MKRSNTMQTLKRGNSTAKTPTARSSNRPMSKSKVLKKKQSNVPTEKEPVKLPQGFEKTIMEMEVSLEKDYTQNKELVVQMLISMYTSAVEHYVSIGDIMASDMYRAKIQMLFAKPNIAQLFIKQPTPKPKQEEEELKAPVLQKSQTHGVISTQPQDNAPNLIQPDNNKKPQQEQEEVKETPLAIQTPSGDGQQTDSIEEKSQQSLSKQYQQTTLTASASQQINRVSVPFTPVGRNSENIAQQKPIDSKKNEELFDSFQDGRMRSASVLQKDMLTQQETLKQRLAQRSRSRGQSFHKGLRVSSSAIMGNIDKTNLLSTKNASANNKLNSFQNNSNDGNSSQNSKQPSTNLHMRKGSLSKKSYLSQSNLLQQVQKTQNNQLDSVTKEDVGFVNVKGMVVRNDVKPTNLQLKNQSDLKVKHTSFDPSSLHQKFMMTKQSKNEVNFSDLLDDINYIKESPSAASKQSPTKSNKSLNQYLSKGDLAVKKQQPSADSEFVIVGKTESMNNSNSNQKVPKKVTIAKGFSQSNSSQTDSFVILDSQTNSNNSSKQPVDEEQIQTTLNQFLQKFTQYADNQIKQVNEKYEQQLRAYEKKPQNALTKKLIQKAQSEQTQAIEKKKQQLEEQKNQEISRIKKGQVKDYSLGDVNSLLF